MKPLISIVIPIYNLEEYITRCLESVKNQTYSNLEIICINDGSTDKSLEVLNNNAKNDKRIIVINKKNEGVTRAREAGIKVAKGEYIGFVDGDDTVENDMFEMLLNGCIKYNADICHCGYKKINNNEVTLYYGTKIILKQNKNKGIIDLLQGKYIDPTLCTKLFKKELFEGAKFDYNIIVNEDLLLNFYMFNKSNLSVFIDETKYNYIYRENSTSTGKITKRKIENELEVSEIILNNFNSNNCIYKYAYERLINSYIEIYKKLIFLNKNTFKDYKKYIINQLKTRKKIYLLMNNISYKRKFISIMIAYFSFIFNIVYKLYKYIKY